MESDFSIGDVLTDAFQAFRARLGTHALFNVVYLVFVGTMGCMVTGCLSAIVLGAAAFFSGEADVESVAGPMSVGVLLSYVAGFLVVVAPGGLGAREFVLATALTPRLTATTGADAAALAVVIALLLRLVWTAAEVLLAVVLYFFRPPAAPIPHHTHHPELLDTPAAGAGPDEKHA